jgi:hypothetical protein
MSYKNTLFRSSDRSLGELILEGVREVKPKPLFFSKILDYMLYLEEYFFGSDIQKIPKTQKIKKLKTIVIIKT